ncbi:hypothetical protein [Natronorubrum bangense]|uniref:Lipoprotein n=2 Tax=Natronorubrum bangense TaxID=61858 RepID=L9WI04_9EURY|nr:hypothetical protein [Natronorubrum bangense]ELY47983.1 hypothetical protein C494_12315 [Natronorubrum bangense JCM 10635]QCC53557.1 hypothetical protein DV706_03100 [Natronorubrum bangense]
MKRRGLLLATAGAVTVAGCSSDDEQTADGEGEAAAEIIEWDVFAAPARGGGSDRSWLRVAVENETAVPHGRLEITSTFRSADGSVVADGTHITSYIPPETTLRYYVQSNFEVDEVDTVDNEFVDANTQVARSALDAVSVQNTELSAGGDVLNVTGDLEFDAVESDRIVVVAPIYDEDGWLRGTGTDILYDPSPTATSEFGANSNGFRAPEGSAVLDSYDVLVFGGRA